MCIMTECWNVAAQTKSVTAAPGPPPCKRDANALKIKSGSLSRAAQVVQYQIEAQVSYGEVLLPSTQKVSNIY